MKILFVAAEGAPFSKTGGLGDVIGALPKSLVKDGHEVGVILPYYDMVEAKFGEEMEDLFHFEVKVGWRSQYVGVKRLVLNGVSFYFIDNQHYFFRGHVYGDFDDGERFAFFQLAAVETMERIDFIPDILHVHDYHTAMIPFLVKEKYRWIQAYQNIKTVLTIHNLEFQGQFSDGMLWDLFGVGYERYADGTLRWNDCLNWMKAGILYADRVTTVSPSYAHEIMTPEFGCGLDQVLRMESGKVIGIVNGIDTDLYNPETDKLLPYHFSKDDLSGKAENKRALQERVGLPVRDDVPLIGIVSRLTRQKGFDLVVEELHNLLQEDVQIVLLGTGDWSFEQSFAWFGRSYPEKLSANILFDVGLAQEIYAASDLFLMPSRFEPCGLSQMMSMRYGTLPLVHEVGGLRDTVEPYNAVEGTGTGFSFNNFSGYWLHWAYKTAIDLYYEDKATWNSLQKQAMSRDFSWDSASKAYSQLYQSLV
ncbi:glycogen synthase GlgA [Streptococcus massiliensis]|uniref:Glycogen synthase n=1 Tax=Streptococcus massiliensis TaxID=313439 RepID=A0A380KZ19_9STRE|nr:glycogen synthase GlgA [Streptococcus massiliensis]SUN76875.1 glycogen synthase, ADP-glucose type [Streptococcus massiliensis]